MKNHINKEQVKKVTIRVMSVERPSCYVWEKGEAPFEKMLNEAIEKINSTQYHQSNLYGEKGLAAIVGDREFRVIYE